MRVEVLCHEIQSELASVRAQLLAHPYVAAVEQGLIELPQLRPFAGEQYAIISGAIRSVAHLVSRFGDDFFLDVLAGERVALEALGPFASAMKMSSEQVRFFDLFAEPAPGFEERAPAVIAAGLERGVPPRLVRRAARLLQGYEMLYWDTLLSEL